MGDIKLDGIDFKEIFTAAVFKALGDESQKLLLQGAIASLMEKNDSRYGGGKTKLQELFESALHSAARDHIVKLLNEDPTVQDTINDLIKQAVYNISTKNRETTVSKIADKIIEGLSPERY